MTRVNDPVELGRVVRARRRELHETQQAIADVCGASRGSIGKLERGAGGVQLRIALMVVQTLGLNVEVIARDAGACRPGEVGVRSCVGTRISAGVVVLLRGALYAELSRAFEDAPDTMPEAHTRSGWADVLARIDGIRRALDVLGWNAPAQQQDVEVELDRAMIDALEADMDLWEWLAGQHRTETAEGRRRAAAKATTVKRFLASVTPTVSVKH